MTDLSQAEYASLRQTIRERGTARLCAVLAGLAVWGALAIALHITRLGGGLTLVPFVVLAATFEINFFVHTGVERIGRFIQVFYEERAGAAGWETIAMNYGVKFPGGGLDPLFSMIFAAAAILNFLSSFAVAQRGLGWIVLSLLAHLAFAYRIVTARKLSAAQRALDLDRFRSLRQE
jgi:hypothetical protein